MYKSPSPLPADVRTRIAESLNDRLSDGLDLHSQIKVAHWNIKGPQFAALHPLFESFAVGLAVMLTLLPAMLTSVGRWVFWPNRPRYGSPDPTTVTRASALP